MSRYGVEYRISRSTGVCAETGDPLEPGVPCVAALCERVEDDGFDRIDYAVDAWEAGARPERLFSYWKTTVPHPDARKRAYVDEEVLMDLFEGLADDDRRQRIAYRFILGLMLMRKRRLKYVGRREEGEHERWLMIPRGAEPETPPIEVIDPRLTDEDVRELTLQIGEVLQVDL